MIFESFTVLSVDTLLLDLSVVDFDLVSVLGLEKLPELAFELVVDLLLVTSLLGLVEDFELSDLEKLPDFTFELVVGLFLVTLLLGLVEDLLVEVLDLEKLPELTLELLLDLLTDVVFDFE
ncbi:hypothetical protein [Clostridium senegalense]|uniref:hypothetical protein n=1 Tax=Clostridium senegalense TaxID=1465809 RepID=UPI00028A0BC7|nr:hypothetical protein [Clostridium senegalense]